jgi:hypothetical protein
MLPIVAELFRVPRPLSTKTIEIIDPVEARRCRYAQYRGEKATLMLRGSPITGMVRSVREDRPSTPMRWIVSVVPRHGIA